MLSCWHLTLSSAYIPMMCVRVFYVCVVLCYLFLHNPVITSGPFLLFLSSPLANTTHGGRTDDTFAGLHLAYEVKKLMYAFYFLLTTSISSIFFFFFFSQFSCFRYISLTFFLQLIKIVLLYKYQSFSLFFYLLIFFFFCFYFIRQYC